MDLLVGNSGAPTRLSSPSCFRVSAVDVTLLSSDLLDSWSWKVLDDTYGSDHYPILVTLHNPTYRLDEITSLAKWSTNNVDWSSFRSKVNDYVSKLDPITNKDANIKHFHGAINVAANLTCKRNRPFMPKAPPPPPWWDNSCTTLSLNRKAALKNYRKSLTISNYVRYKKADAIFRRLCKSKRKESWRQFCSNLNRQTSSSIVWSQVKKN